METFSWALKKILVATLQLYRYFLSPILGQCCRFYPSCSQYAVSAIEKHGAFYGTFLTIKRLLKCHPWHRGGIDLVP